MVDLDDLKYFSTLIVLLFYGEKTATNTTTTISHVLQQGKIISCLSMQKKKKKKEDEIKSSMNHLFACIHEIHLSIQDIATIAAEIYLLKNKSLWMYQHFQKNTEVSGDLSP